MLLRTFFSGVDVFTFGTLPETFDVRFRDHVDNDPCVSLFGTSVASLLKKERPHKKFQECLFCASCGLCSLWPSSPCHCCWVTSTTDNATKKLGQEKSWIDREWELKWWVIRHNFFVRLLRYINWLQKMSWSTSTIKSVLGRMGKSEESVLVVVRCRPLNEKEVGY